jgi:hypothetical protein
MREKKESLISSLARDLIDKNPPGEIQENRDQLRVEAIIDQIHEDLKRTRIENEDLMIEIKNIFAEAARKKKRAALAARARRNK